VIRFGSTDVGDGVPLGCARCAMPNTPSYHSVADVTRALAELSGGWSGAPGPNVVLGGPEPFAHPHLPALVTAAVGAGFERIALETDGAALSVTDNAEGVLRAGVRHIRLRVVTTDERRAAELLPRPAVVSAARRGVTAYRAAAERAAVRAIVTAVVPVCTHTVDSIPSTVADLASWGVDAVRLETAGALPSEAAGLIAAACDTGMVNRLWVETDGGLPLPPSHALHAVPGGGAHE